MKWCPGGEGHGSAWCLSLSYIKQLKKKHLENPKRHHLIIERSLTVNQVRTKSIVSTNKARNEHFLCFHYSSSSSSFALTKSFSCYIHVNNNNTKDRSSISWKVSPDPGLRRYLKFCPQRRSGRAVIQCCCVYTITVTSLASVERDVSRSVIYQCPMSINYVFILPIYQ